MLNILSGVAVLLVTLAFGHLLHHYFIDASHEAIRSSTFWVGLAVAVVVGIFSFIGGCLLLRRSRRFRRHQPALRRMCARLALPKTSDSGQAGSSETGQWNQREKAKGPEGFLGSCN
jgi:hypothetical protein